jgi:hypothetical protein
MEILMRLKNVFPIVAAAATLALFAMPHQTHAQGVFNGMERGANQGAYEGSRAAGPVGGIVGGAVGAGVGGAAGAVGGLFGAPNQGQYYNHGQYYPNQGPYYGQGQYYPNQGRYYGHHHGNRCHGYWKKGKYHCYRHRH